MPQLHPSRQPHDRVVRVGLILIIADCNGAVVGVFHRSSEAAAALKWVTS